MNLISGCQLKFSPQFHGTALFSHRKKSHGVLANLGEELFCLLLQDYQQTKVCRLVFNWETFPIMHFPTPEKRGHRMWNVRVCRICPLHALKLSIGFKSTATEVVHWHKPCGKPPDTEKISTLCFLHASDRSGYQMKGTRKSKRKNDLVVLHHTSPPRARACG